MTVHRYGREGLDRRDLQLVHEHITTHLAERITLDDLAQATGHSRFHFCRLFRRSMGTSPMQYLQRCRLEHAKQLLADGRLSMADVAAASGYCDQSHLSRSFRRFTGMTPREFARAGDGGAVVAGALCTESHRVDIRFADVRLRQRGARVAITS